MLFAYKSYLTCEPRADRTQALSLTKFTFRKHTSISSQNMILTQAERDL